MTNVYLFDWHETHHGQQPKPEEVDTWLKAQGVTTIGRTKVYANGTVQVEVDEGEVDVEAIWPDFSPMASTPTDRLSAHIRELMLARAELLAIPENRRNATDRLLLANTALLLFGYGVTD